MLSEEAIKSKHIGKISLDEIQETTETGGVVALCPTIFRTRTASLAKTAVTLVRFATHLNVRQSSDSFSAMILTSRRHGEMPIGKRF
jgi:hypothetical protein